VTAPVRAAGIRLSDADLTAIRAHAGVDAMEDLDGYESLIYRSTTPPGRIVRVTHTSRRSVEHVEAEAALLRVLQAEGVGVAAPVEDVPVFRHRLADGQTVVCLVTDVAPGSQRSVDAWDDSAIAAYGRLMGRFHHLSRTHPALATLARPRWDDPIMLSFETDLAGSDADPSVLEYGAATLSRLIGATRDVPSLLIHQDAHLANLHITDDDQITLFDFDDAAYGPAEYDLAMIVFYWIAGRSLPDTTVEVRRLLDAFLPAYEEEAGSVDFDSELIDLFLTYRELDIYAAVVGQHADDPWARTFMHGRPERIAARAPFLGVAFAEL
jgi:Ser/Thr protein kinase RdoA (MazF antagonist)